MIEPKLTFFKMQIKSRFGKASELCQTHFSNSPKVFDAINMGLAVCKFIVAMLNSIMLFITQVHKTVIALPPIGVDGAFKIHLAPDHRL